MKKLILLYSATFLQFAIGAPEAQQPFEITVGPESVLANPGGETTLAASVRGAALRTCQWRWNGVPIAGETNPKLVLHNQIQNTGDYDVEVECESGRALSKTVHFEVKPLWDDHIALRYRLANPASAGAPA